MGTRTESKDCAPGGLLDRLGLVGLASIEPVILAALASGEPLLLIGPHGTGKSYLLARICVALGLEWRHYNASLLNFDDLVGYPLPNGKGGLEFVRTPASVWGAQAVFFDEISRCRPDIQNKLFPIIHERRVQGILLDSLVYRWSAMNPPADEHDLELDPYRGSEPLDLALADRFAFVVAVPGWRDLSDAQQEELLVRSEEPLDPTAGQALRLPLARARTALAALTQERPARLTAYVRLVLDLIREHGVETSPRRAAMLLRNILATHAARLAVESAADLAESALLALCNSLPQPAAGIVVSCAVLGRAHREAWEAAGVEPGDPRRIVLFERDPLRRALLAADAGGLAPAERSAIVADALATLPLGARHALAVELFESECASALVAAVAEQCAELCALVTTPQEISEVVNGRSQRFRVWQRVVQELGRRDKKSADRDLLSNLVVGLFAREELAAESDVERVVASWVEARERIRGVRA